MATHQNQDALLAKAFDKADEAVLRSTLKAMCSDSETCRSEAMRLMLITKKKRAMAELSASDSEDNEGDDSGDSEAEGDDVEPKPKRRKTESVDDDDPGASTLVLRYEKCETCKETYDVTTNNSKACRTHGDTLEIDPEHFPDDDDVQDNPDNIDPYTDWRREEFPEGFRWNCCDQPGNGKPCVIQRHKKNTFLASPTP